MKAVVMAGGFGTRIQPLTRSIPKPMLPILNKPMMEWTMMALKEVGVKEFIVLLYFKPEIIQDYFKDGSDFGIKITYVIPDGDYGTAGAVKLAQKLIGNENFIIISGDLVTNFDFRKILDYHEKKKSKITITLTSVENPLEFGVVIANKEGKIEKFLEKPSWGEVFSDTINTGVYVIEPEILEYIPQDQNFDFAKDLFPLLMSEGIDVMAGNAGGYWRDVGNAESYRDVHEDIFNKKIKIKADGEKIKYPEGWLFTKTKGELDKSVEILGTVVLGENVSLGKGVKLKDVAIGNNVTIGDECKIRNSIIWNDVNIKRNATLDNCVICDHNEIGQYVTAKSGMILAEGCEIGQLASVEKDVTIWPNKIIEAASIVSGNMVLGSKYKNSIFENGIVIGKSNVEISCEMATKLAEAFGAQLPVGSKVVVSRDSFKNSNMLKRSFIGGLLSCGIDVVDYGNMSVSVTRYNLCTNEDYVGGVHFSQMIDDSTSSVVAFFKEDGLRVDRDMAKKVEKAFFKEQFRRVDYAKTGQVLELSKDKERSRYKRDMLDVLRSNAFSCYKCRVAVDVMHGKSAEILPDILAEMEVDAIAFNAHPNESRLSNFQATLKQSILDVSAVVKALNLTAGFILHPDEQRLDVVCDKGILLEKQTSLDVALTLLNMDAKANNVVKRVFLPTWARDATYYDSLKIDRGNYSNFKAERLKKYDLVATGEGNFAFTEFMSHRDSIYATLKILELASRYGMKLSEIIASLPIFYYRLFKVECSQAMKGKTMRAFLEDAQDKKTSTVDGVKVWLDENDWILMIPDQYNEHLNLYVQAKDDASGEKILADYVAKIEGWLRNG